jgi:hypothetical protein
MKLSIEELDKNFSDLVNVIETEFSGDRKEKLLRLYNDWSDRIATAPAASKKQHHNAFPGGYVIHVMNVVNSSLAIETVWKSMGAVIDYTREELIFSALSHDLGKIGDENQDYYIPCTEDWMIKKGQVYVSNPNLQYMKVPDRSIHILMGRGIAISETEYLSIKLHDGLYEESNKAYLMSYNEDYELHSILPYIIHQADLLSSKVEKVKKERTVLKPLAKKNIPATVKTGNKTLDKFLNE